MPQEHEIYRVLLELKESAGKTSAKLDDIKESIEQQSTAHERLLADHNQLKESHNSYKGKILLVSSFVGSIFGAATTWVYKTFFGGE